MAEYRERKDGTIEIIRQETVKEIVTVEEVKQRHRDVLDEIARLGERADRERGKLEAIRDNTGVDVGDIPAKVVNPDSKNPETPRRS